MTSAATPSSAAMKARLDALRAIASLPPLSLAVAHVGDAVLRELVDEISEQCLRDAAPP